MMTFAEKRFFDWEEDEIAVTLRNKSGSYGGGQRSIDCVMQRGINGDIAETLDGSYWKGCGSRGGCEREIVMEFSMQRTDEYKRSEQAKTVAHRDYKAPTDLIVKGQYMESVRRLTPTECERLQGYPDGWSDLGEWEDSTGRIHKEADTPRYKALGNSIATPFWFYLLRRISAQYERPATLGSLFDGISGFPYAWTKCNGTGTCLWSSEIEEFPIAVCKKHFGDEETGEEGDIGKYL